MEFLMSDIRIVTLADFKYFKYVKALVNSIKQNLAGVKVHVYLINLTKEYGKILQSIYPNLEYTIEDVKFQCDLQKKCYCTNRRSKILNDLRKSTKDILVWLDADSLVVREIPEFIDFVQDCDLSVRFKNDSDLNNNLKKKNKKKPRGFMAGLIVVGTSEESKIFIEMYDEMLSQNSYKKIKINYTCPVARLPLPTKVIWMANQDVLFSVYKKIKDRINFKPLPQKYLDCSFSEKTAIWSVKASNRSDKKFDKIFQKYKIK
jgi:hypothetical protein